MQPKQKSPFTKKNAKHCQVFFVTKSKAIPVTLSICKYQPLPSITEDASKLMTWHNDYCYKQQTMLIQNTNTFLSQLLSGNTWTSTTYSFILLIIPLGKTTKNWTGNKDIYSGIHSTIFYLPLQSYRD